MGPAAAKPLMQCMLPYCLRTAPCKAHNHVVSMSLSQTTLMLNCDPPCPELFNE